MKKTGVIIAKILRVLCVISIAISLSLLAYGFCNPQLVQEGTALSDLARLYGWASGFVHGFCFAALYVYLSDDHKEKVKDFGPGVLVLIAISVLLGFLFPRIAPRLFANNEEILLVITSPMFRFLTLSIWAQIFLVFYLGNYLKVIMVEQKERDKLKTIYYNNPEYIEEIPGKE